MAGYPIFRIKTQDCYWKTRTFAFSNQLPVQTIQEDRIRAGEDRIIETVGALERLSFPSCSSRSSCPNNSRR
jgi:hypothetical protein